MRAFPVTWEGVELGPRMKTPKLLSNCFALGMFFFPCLFLSSGAFLFSVRDEQNSTRSQASKTLAQIYVQDGTCMWASRATPGAGGCASCSAVLWQTVSLIIPVLPTVWWPCSCAAPVTLSPPVPQQMIPFQFVSWGWERSPAWQSGEREVLSFLTVLHYLSSIQGLATQDSGESCAYGIKQWYLSFFCLEMNVG